jgi:putative ABC transport system permease protein
MKLLDSLKTAIATLASHRLRSGLTILGLIIGNASVITLIGLGEGAKQYTRQQLDSLGSDVLTIIPTNSDDEGTKPMLVLADADSIKQLPAVAKAAPILFYRLDVTAQGHHHQTFVLGTDPDILGTRNATVARGRFFSQSESQEAVATIGPSLARILFPDRDPIGQKIEVNRVPLTITGVMKAKGSFLGQDRDDVVLLPIAILSGQVMGRSSPYGIPLDYLEVLAKDSQRVRAAAFQSMNVLTLRHGGKDVSIQTQKAFLEMTDRISEALSLFLSAIAAISLLVGGIGVMNIMLVSVTERTSEIGLRKAIGATQGDILGQFLIESVLLCLLGGMIGTGCGFVAVHLIGFMTVFPAVLPWGAIGLSLAISGTIGLFFGVFPAYQAAKLEAIVALRGG